MLTSINPTTGTLIKTYAALSPPALADIMQRAETAFQKWRKMPFAERAQYITQLASLLRAHNQEYATLMAQEMGKPVREGLTEIEKCAVTCEYYARHAAEFLQPETIATEAKNSFVTFQPLGVILAIMPWNFPFWQVFRCAIPALMAGNVLLLKHASNVSGCALAIAALFQQANFPQGVFSTLLLPGTATDPLIAHPAIAAVTLTGSTAAGQAVASAAGKALKKTVLELGGSDPYIVLADADLELAATICANARLVNAGQSCIAAKRFIVVAEIREAFEKLFLHKMQQITMGDPLQPNTQMGPLARADLREQLHRQVQQSMAMGATCLIGGKIPEGPGFFYPPTVLTNVQPGMPAYEEELFGPVAAIIPVDDTAAAIATANNSQYGLGAAIFSRNVAAAEQLATEELQAGSCFINAQVHSDPRLPFGGIKASGYGRELSHFGIKEFVNIKSVFCN